MDSHIEHILAQLPELNAADPVVTPLVGGITNQNYRIDVGGESFVLRIGGRRGTDVRHKILCNGDEGAVV